MDPGFEKGGGAGGSGSRPQDLLGQFRGLFEEIGAKMGGRAAPAPPFIDPHLGGWVLDVKCHTGCRMSKRNHCHIISLSSTEFVFSLFMS